MLASAKLPEKNVWLSVGTEETNSVFNCQLCHGLKAQKIECVLTKTTLTADQEILSVSLMALNIFNVGLPLSWLVPALSSNSCNLKDTSVGSSTAV
jgi:hypothetical protein